jgi:hypothetical protein
VKQDESYDVQEHLGIESLQSTFYKSKKDRKMPMICPFLNCNRQFVETGNLKTHLRIHVSRIYNTNSTFLAHFVCFFRLGNVLLSATSMVAGKCL